MKKDRGFNSERRTFMRAAAGFAGATVFGGLPFRAFAQATEAAKDRCFIFVYFNGGWDQLLAFDPRDPAVFTGDRVAETRILPGYDLINDASYSTRPVQPPNSNIAFGPAIGRLANHYDLMAVIRGINMNTLAHEVGYRYFLTGKEPSGTAARGSSAATEIVAQMKPLVPIPSLAYGVESYNDRWPGSANALRVTRADDLLLTLSPSSVEFDSEIEKQLLDMRGQPTTAEAAAYDSRGLLSTYSTSREQMATVLSNKLDTAFRFEAPENAAVRAHYKLPATKQSSTTYETPAGRAATVATALKRGISQCVSINFAGGLDTHFGSQKTHADRLRLGFDALADLIQDLRTSEHPKHPGTSFMDHTTIMVFSEFARTPLINSTGGRDHHLANSCALIGAGIKHNVVFGGTGNIGMAAGVFDLSTGQATSTGRNIMPEHVLATVLASAGLDYDILREEPLKPLLDT
ncbi:MAG: DUF1501 domain-containing protein [Myxococcaceae bacterium]